MADKRKRLNIVPDFKDEIFLTNQVDLRFYPDLFKIEFKQVNQQVDRIGESRQETLIINRRSIALTPLVMKQFVGIVNNMLANYEKQHGEIKLPKLPKKRKAARKSTSGDYIG
jgi:hypothetical protein